MKTIKDNAELRHFLRHMLYAIEYLTKNKNKAALYEIKSIESMVSWQENDKAFQQWCERRWQHGKKNGNSKRKRKKYKKV